jgi:choline dehydrogenase
VLPFFRALEDDQDEGGDLHGRGGPLPITRARGADLHPVQCAFVDACRALGFEEAADHNHPDATGVGPWPMNVRGDLRVSTAIGYLPLPASGSTSRSGRTATFTACFAAIARSASRHRAAARCSAHGRRVTLSAGQSPHRRSYCAPASAPAADLAALGIRW